jgi:hypothetical protein
VDRHESTVSPTRTYGTPFRNAMRRVSVDDDLVMLIGPASNGALLEIGVLDLAGDDPVVIHAQPLRGKFHKFLG